MSGRKMGAIVFALAGLLALGYSAYRGRQRYLREHPPPLPNVIAPIPPGQEKAVREGMRLIASKMLKLSAEQGKQLAEVWKTPPRSVEELIQYNKRTDKILTPDQLAIIKPLRKVMQGQVVDKMLAPASARFTPEDFAKLKKEIKARVAQRIDGP